jgi:hypothetical protein
VVDAIPSGTQFVRGWDLAATPKIEGNDPDWTVGTKIGRMHASQKGLIRSTGCFIRSRVISVITARRGK